MLAHRGHPEPDRAERFRSLQAAMAPAFAAGRARAAGRAIVVVPSRTVDKWHERAAETRAYEERLLCLLLALADPGLELTYVTSLPVAPQIVDRYLSLLPSRARGGARRRLRMLALRDDSPRPLSEKLLGHPLMLERIRAAIAGRAHRHLVPYTTTALERDLALELGIPMYAADPRHAHLGTKSGSRELFAAAGVARPLGIEHVHGVASAVEAIARLRLTKPGIAELVMKLDQGVSGDGNAIIDLRGLPAPGGAGERSRIRERIAAMALEADGVERDAYLAKLAARGGIVEERIVGEEIRSPSVQIQVTPAGAVEVLSTHDQLLGGESGQRYLGCRFPADPAYAVPVAELAERVGRRLAAAGVIGRSAIDFVVVRDGDGRWRPYAIELNLRKGGTTHPFVALQLLAGGGYDAGTGVYTAADGRRKHYVATDHLQAPELRALGRQGALEIAGRPDLRFDATRGWGVVPHMLSAVDELGRMGLTAIAGSAQEAQWLYERACSGLLEAGREAAAIGRRERARDGDVGQTGISEARR